MANLRSDKIMELMYNISIASFISLLMFLIIWYFSTLPTFKSSINVLNNQTISFLIFCSFLLILALPYRGKTSRNFLIKMEKFYAKKYPFIIMGIGYSLILVSFLVIFNIPPKAITSKVYGLILGLTFFGFILIPIGFYLLIVSLSAKKYLEGKVSFTLKKANALLYNIEDKNKLDTKNLKRYIYLTYKNIEKKMGNVYTLDFEYTFLNYLPYYIEFAEKEQLQSLKNNLETMLKLANDVNEKDKINWRSLIQEIKKLNDDIIKYLREDNFNFTNKKLSRQSDWILKNKDTIVQVIGLIVPIILFILSLHYRTLSPNVP